MRLLQSIRLVTYCEDVVMVSQQSGSLALIIRGLQGKIS